MLGKKLPFPKNTQKKSPIEGHAINQLSRQHYQEKWADLTQQVVAWKRVAMVTSGSLVLSIIGMYLITTQQRIVPYVIKVDELGSAQAVRRADIPDPPSANQFKAHLARWIEDTRSIYTDAGAEKVAMKFSFGSTLEGSTAQQQLLDYMGKNNPYKLAEDKSVTVNVASVQPISDKTWRVEWNEKTFSRNGSPISEDQMQATITVSVVPPTDEATILNNPLGIYIQNFNWSSRIQ